jgi:uncharacterized membrane protein YGL010W
VPAEHLASAPWDHPRCAPPALVHSDFARGCRRAGSETDVALMSERSWSGWIAEYAKSHHHPVNRLCHLIGIPLIATAVVMFVAALFVHAVWATAVVLFVVGWTFQFVGHAFERKAPEFLKDWRFLFVGLGWWVAKLRGQA